MLKRMLMVAALMGAGLAAAAEEVSDMAIQLFGKEESGKRVETGALFIDGLYIKGPYEVTRQGNVIFINGRVASRFKVEAKAKAAAEQQAAREAAAKERAEAKAKAAEEAKQAAEDRRTAARAQSGGATPRQRQNIRGGLKERQAQKQRDQAIAAASRQSGFNTDPSGGDPTALFEEADYTYTPPDRPEPKAVPYVRPGAKQNLRQRIAARDERVAAAKKQQQAETADDGEEIATENFDDLTDEEIKAYTEQFAKRRATLETLLARDSLLLLSSQSSGALYKNQTTMCRFVTQLGGLCQAGNANKLISAWGKEIPRAYLQRIYNNRTANSTEMESLVRRAKDIIEAARKRSESRI